MFILKYLVKTSPKTSKEKKKKKINSMTTTTIEEIQEKEEKLCCSSTPSCLNITSSSSSYNNQNLHVTNYCKSRETSTRASRSSFQQTTTSLIFPNAQFTTHISLPSLSEAFSIFTRTFPKFIDTQKADFIRNNSYPHLSKHVCFDYTGFSLFDYGNNCQEMKTTTRSGLESALRDRIMSFVNVSEIDYAMVCTANKASALKLLVEAYPFQDPKGNKKLLTVYDHDCEAITAMQDTAHKKGAKTQTATFSWPHLRINSAKLKKALMGDIINKNTKRNNKKRKKKKGLFVFPLQSRMSGARYPYFWMRMAQENGWDVVLDACALGPKDMDSLGLSLIQPEFIICSFYQVIGHNPSGFSTLFVRNNNPDVTISETSAAALFVDVSSDVDCVGLDHADSLGLLLIGSRMRCFTNWLVLALTKLKHPNGSTDNSSLVRIYGPRVRFERGNGIAFNVYDWKGEKVEPLLVQKLADRSGISLSCGFLRGLSFSEKYEEERSVVLERRDEGEMGIEVVNVSIGFLANFEDLYRLWCFVARFLDADFVEKERWRYMALNQRMVEV